jgi:hypothetical protein
MKKKRVISALKSFLLVPFTPSLKYGHRSHRLHIFVSEQFPCRVGA